MQKQEKKTGGEGRGPALQSTLTLLKGGALAAGTAVLLLAICAGLITAGVVKEKYGEGCVLASCVVGAFSGGLYAVKSLRTRPLPVGLAVGTILLLLLFSAGFLTCGEIFAPEKGSAAAAACLIGGTISGLLCCNSRKKRRKSL